MAEPYCFGRFTLDPVAGRLYANDEPVSLGSTDFRILLALVEKAGALVTKNDLIALVWGRAAVSDNVLYVHINALRKTVGEECIENQQRRGYRFAVPVRRTEPGILPRIRPSAGNLPSYWIGNPTGGPTRLIGRGEPLRVVSDLLARGRLVSLIGPGGVGKTRLVLQAASEASPSFHDGVWLVELATLSNTEMVPSAIASVLGIKIGAEATPLDTLSRFLARKSLLLVLDNCEHLVAACAHVSETILAAAPGVRILATSREALSCSGEQVLEVPPLDVPHEVATLPDVIRGMAAVELFIERAQEADSSFRITDEELPTVARICRRVDGLPLAIEMVAGWAGLLGLETLDTKLDGSLNAWLRARTTAPSRHSTLRATLEWSHGLLSSDEQTVLYRLAVFADSFTLPVAETVAGDNDIRGEQVFALVASLIRKSMIASTQGTGPQRYRLLETTRVFMLERLVASGEENVTRQRHALYVLSVLERASSELETTSDAIWLERYRPMLEDLRTALDWAMRKQSDIAVALAGASWPLWRELSLRTEGRQRLSMAAARLRPDTPPSPKARLHRGLGDMLLNTSATKEAHAEIERAAMLYRALGDAPNLGSALTALGFSLFMLDRIEEAEQAILEALNLLEPAGWLRTLATAYSIQLCVEAIRGRFDAALSAGEKAARLSKMAGADRTAFVVAVNLVQVSLESGDIDDAISRGRALATRLRDTHYSDLLGFVLGVLAGALTARIDLDEALIVAREAAPLLRDEGSLLGLFDHLALRAALAGRAKDAALIAGYANSAYGKNGQPREPMGRQAMERTGLLLRDLLCDKEASEFGRLGERLSEDQVLSIALS